MQSAPVSASPHGFATADPAHTLCRRRVLCCAMCLPRDLTNRFPALPLLSGVLLESKNPSCVSVTHVHTTSSRVGVPPMATAIQDEVRYRVLPQLVGRTTVPGGGLEPC